MIKNIIILILFSSTFIYYNSYVTTLRSFECHVYEDHGIDPNGKGENNCD